MHPLVRFSACALLLGCGDPEPASGSGEDEDTAVGDDTGAEPASCFDQAPAIDVGTGTAGFEPLATDDPVVMVHGPQGGWHLVGSVRTHNMTDVVRIHFEVSVVETGAVVADNSLYVQTLSDGECRGVYPGMYAYLVVDDLAEGEADTPPELLAYEPLLFRASVEDRDGRTASAEVQITAVPDPVDLEGGGDTGTPGR